MSDYNYEKNNCTRVSIKLGNKTDADIIECLNRQDNKQGYIKQLIREDISKEKLINEHGYGLAKYLLNNC